MKRSSERGWGGDLDRVARLAGYVYEELHALGNERIQLDGALVVRNRDIRAVRDANMVMRVTASSPVAIDRLMGRVEAAFEGFPHRKFLVGPHTPPWLEARLALEDYSRADFILMLLEGGLQRPTKRYDIQPVDSETDWNVFSSLHDTNIEEAYRKDSETFGVDTDHRAISSNLIQSNRLKSPPVQYWLARVDGFPCGYCSSWQGAGGIGLVEDVFTHPGYRRRGVATALVRHGVEACRAKGAAGVLISALATDTPKRIYAALGFRPVMTLSSYWRETPTSPA